MFRTHSETWLVSDHPVRSSKEASRYFIDVASTPPLGGGEYPADQFELNSGVAAARPVSQEELEVPQELPCFFDNVFRVGHSPLTEEGWTRHQEDVAKPPLRSGRRAEPAQARAK